MTCTNCILTVSAHTASLTLGGPSHDDEEFESVFTFHDQDSSAYSMITTIDNCSQPKGNGVKCKGYFAEKLH